VAAFFISMLVAMPVFFLWLVVVALLVRPFGVQLPPFGPFGLGKRTRAVQALTFVQHVFVHGVLGFGCGMLIFRTVSDYVEWKYFHGSSATLTTTGLLHALFAYPLMGGVLFGLISWNTRAGETTK
jgi:hypothetical protein